MPQEERKDGGGESRVVQAGPETRSWLQLLTARWPATDSASGVVALTGVDSARDANRQPASEREK